MKNEPIFKVGNLIEYNVDISYDKDGPREFAYILEVICCTNHREEYQILAGDTTVKLVHDSTMGLPRWYTLDKRVEYITPIAIYDADGKKSHNPRIFTWN